MPIRKGVLATNEIYHVLNRGVASSIIFNEKREYKRFIDLVDFYRFDGLKVSFSAFNVLGEEKKSILIRNFRGNDKLLVEIYAYCLMPNHFHFLVKQLIDDGIKKTFTKIQNAYAKYFNIRNQRNGPLFQSRFKAIRIESDEIFLHVSRYIHLNPCTSYLVDFNSLGTYDWSSYKNYINTGKSEFIECSRTIEMVGGVENYKNFLSDQVGYQRKLSEIKGFILED